MSADDFEFGPFRLDVANRRLTRNGEPADLSPRYLDALALLVRERGNLVSKSRFLDEVWAGVPVTDEALTQAIRTLRRQLGDDASMPRYIETVPKHGYRFIAPVENGAPSEHADLATEPSSRGTADGIAGFTAAGTLGAAVSGIVGGLIYGLVEGSNPEVAGSGALSVLLVYVCITTIVATLGGAGVTFGMAVARRLVPSRFAALVTGGVVGGTIVGALVKLIGVDASELLFGQSPGDVTGAFEGALLGGGIGLAYWLAGTVMPGSVRRGGLVAVAVLGCVGIVVPLLGGRMLGGSLDLLATSFPGSRLQFGQIGLLFGEPGFGPNTALATGGLEGALFGACVVMALLLHRRKTSSPYPP